MRFSHANGLAGITFFVEPATGILGRLESFCRDKQLDLLIGNSKGYRMSRELKVPLIRAGFPIHDRVGANRQLLLGYRGTMALFDLVINALLEKKQADSPIGFSYL